jgi:hypothetical protein
VAAVCAPLVLCLKYCDTYCHKYCHTYCHNQCHTYCLKYCHKYCLKVYGLFQHDCYILPPTAA